MALKDDSTLVIGHGNFYRAPIDTPIPTDLLNPGATWENIGHTSLEDIFSQSSEGGEATVLGTLQNKTLRTTYSPRSESFAITLQQFDVASLKLYYGSNAQVGPNGELQVPENPIPTKEAFLGVFVDGESVFGVWAPKAEYFRGDDLALSDTESLAGLPLAVKPVKSGTNAFAFAVTPIEDVVP